MDVNVGLLLAKRAALSPELEAVVEVGSGRRFSYAALDARANRTASALRAAGVAPGDRVALLLLNGVEFVESFFAIAKLGAIVVPLNWRLVPDELAFILKDSGARTLIFGAELCAAARDLHARGGAGTDVEAWVQVGESASAPLFARSYDALQAAASDAPPAIGARDDDPLYIMYTSGTTGLPKGVVHTHASAVWAVITMNATSEVRYRDRYLVALPLFHVGALSPLTANVQRGITNVVMKAFDPESAWATIEREQLTTMLAVPAMLNFMLQAKARERCDRRTLRWIMSGAAPVPTTLIQAYADLGIEIHQVYGLTECCGPACLTSPEDALRKVGSTGKPFFHTEVRVVDDDDRDVAPGVPGEVIVRGRHVMREYWNRPDATREALRGGWLRTGDLAVMDADGFVFIHDRKKDLIITGGENVTPAEVENVILAHPDVLDVAVIGQPSSKWGESPAAIVVRGDPKLDETGVLEWCRDRIARYKQPRRVEFVDEIPRNPSGKILKRVLRERFPGPAPD